jgi:hypothetical protein
MTIRNRSRSNEFTFIPIVFIQSQKVSFGAKLVWLSTASRRQAHEPDPTLETLCAETGLNQAGVKEAENELNHLSDAQWQALGLPL